MYNVLSDMTKYSCFALAVSMALMANAQEETATKEKPEDKDTYSERMLIVGKKESLNTEAGSAAVVDESELEKFEFDNINQILGLVPGVNLRQEDGYGLRPNIGFRGVTPERSKKINILEDGILIGPAPYSAPAAYYFPMVSRLSSLEVIKGPSSILYGPNTVAGTLNMQTRQVTAFDKGMVDIAFGSDRYNKAHVYTVQSEGNFGFLIEGITTQTDGFKKLDNGGDTGFEKNNLTTKFRYNLNTQNYNQVIELKLAYADEVSDETYLGLTSDDFAATPYRRYAATQLAKMDWEHQQLQFNHFLEGDTFDVTTRLYRNEFDRAWRKMNNFNDAPSLQQILQDPATYENFYQVLTGQKDSEAIAEQLLIGTNDRSFYSQGIQSDLRWQTNGFDLDHHIKAGIRFHEDQIERNHYEDFFNMRSGVLVSAGSDTRVGTVNREYSETYSLYFQDTVALDKWEFTAGIRTEFIDSHYKSLKQDEAGVWLDKKTQVWLPAASAFYSFDNFSGVFAGVHRGFVPTSPKQAPEIDVETSKNLELGYRYYKQGRQLELVGFYTDYDNLKESCTLSTSSNCTTEDNLDREYNAGKVSVFGVESKVAERFSPFDSFDIPVSLIYTYTQAEFDESFDSDFYLWGDVTAGDPVPYLPEHQLTLSVGLEASQWRTNFMARYNGSMHEAAGEGVTLSGVETPAYWVLDMSAAYDFTNYGSIYFKVDNLLDETHIMSRRPFGARPNKPRHIYAGYKYYW